MVLEAAKIGGIQFHPADQGGDGASAVQVQAVKIFQRKIVRVNIDSHVIPSSR
jgi:hypothetical protein